MKRIGFKHKLKNTAKRDSFKGIRQQMVDVGTFLTLLDKSEVLQQTIHLAVLKRSTVNVKG